MSALAPCLMFLIPVLFLPVVAKAQHDKPIGKVVKINGHKTQVDGRRAQSNTGLYVGTTLTAARGNNSIEMLFDEIYAIINAGQMTVAKDMTKSGERKGRHLKLQLDNGILCLRGPGNLKDLKFRVKSGPHELLLQQNSTMTPFAFCLERGSNESLIYWRQGSAKLQKIKPKKITFHLDKESWWRWEDAKKAPVEADLYPAKKTRFLELLQVDNDPTPSAKK